MTRSQFMMVVLISVIMLLFSPTILKSMKKREQEDHRSDPEFHQGKDMRPRHFGRAETPLLRGLDILRVVMLLLLLVVARDFFGFLQSIWDMILPVSLYYGLMLLLLPLLRRYIDPRTCGLLWMYPLTVGAALTFITYNNGGMLIPSILIYVPPALFKGVLALWLAGAAAYLGWSIYTHFRFRAELDRFSQPADQAITALWDRESRLAGWNWPTPVYVTSQLQSPVIVGIRKTKMELYLPDKAYTDRELQLIFRHEVRHILRRDNETKFAWTIIRALLWFAPLVWVASQRAAEDIELSCDEYVLQGADEMTRMYYADLLLNTAGDSRGFSTCLSAKASTLRHRLKCVVTPPKRVAGSLLLALAAILLLLTCGQVSFVTEKGLVGEYYQLSAMDSGAVEYQGPWLEEMLREERGNPYVIGIAGTVRDPQTLMPYLESLSITRMPDRLRWLDDLGADSHSLTIRFDTSDMWFSLELKGDYMQITRTALGDVSRLHREIRLYRFDQPLDWELICSTLHLEE